MVSTNRTVRNGRVELLRFLAGLSIAVYHFGWLYCGNPGRYIHFYIWVEFFFVLSGFFLAANAVRPVEGGDEDSASLRYVGKELKKLWPLYLIAFVYSFLVQTIPANLPLEQYLPELLRQKWEVLALSIFNFDANAPVYNAGGAVAYIGSMLFASLILHYLIRHHRKAYLSTVAPIFVLIGYGRIMTAYGNLSQWFAYDGWVSAGIIRALAGMSVGAMFYLLLSGKTPKRTTLFAMEGTGLAAILALVVFYEQISFDDLILCVPAFGMLITACYLRPAYRDSKINKACVWLGKLSYPMFLFHYGTILLMKMYVQQMSPRLVRVIYLVILFCGCAAIVCVESSIRKMWQRAKDVAVQNTSGEKKGEEG